MKINTKRVVLALAMAMPSVAVSQAPQLEEIVVTAQKRVQSLQDVPVAVSALSGDWMKQNNIADIDDVAALIPNFRTSGTPGINTVRIRGLGTGGGNAGFEQSVGMYVDGIYAGRGYQFSLPYLDVERIEVLKGPQGVLLGKNSIAGAISINSARPSEEFEAQIGVSYEAEHEGNSVEAVVNGELAPGLSGRFAASQITEGGWINNTLLNESDQGEVEMSGVRASLLWDASEDIQVYLKYDHGEYDKTGSVMGIKHIAPGTGPAGPNGPPWSLLYGLADPNYGLIEDHLISGGRSLTSKPDGNYKNVESDAVTLQVDSSVGEHTFTMLTSYSSYDVEKWEDSSFSPLTIVNRHGDEEFSQITQELRLTSPEGGQFEYIVGLFFLDRSLDFPANYTDLSLTNLFGPKIPPALTAPLPLPPGVVTPLDTSIMDATLVKQYNEETRSTAAFGQLTWNISDVLRASLGLRYSREEKDADHKHSVNVAVTDPLQAAIAKGAYNALFRAKDYTLSLSRTEENVDPSLNIQWDMSNDLMVYAAATKATKAGGFNSGSMNDNLEAIEYEEEEATGYEIGAKGEFLDNRLRLNAAAFYTEFDDLQVSQLDANSGNFFIGNAARATSKGLELDATYAMSEFVTIGGSLAYLDSYFNDFKGAPCAKTIYQQADCDVNTLSRDASGDTNIHSPEWSGNFYVDYSVGFTGNTVLGVRIDALYVDDFGYSLTYADPLRQDSYVKWNARVSLAAADESWELALVGKNLSDKTTTSFGDETFQNNGVYFGSVDAPRQIYLNASKRF